MVKHFSNDSLSLDIFSLVSFGVNLNGIDEILAKIYLMMCKKEYSCDMFSTSLVKINNTCACKQGKKIYLDNVKRKCVCVFVCARVCVCVWMGVLKALYV